MPAELARVVHRFAFGQFGDRGPASHGRNAALGKKTDIGNSPAFQLERELQNVSASGILQLGRGVRLGDCAWVSRILKVIENFGGIHSAIVMRSPEGCSPYRGLALFYNGRMSKSHSAWRIACLQPSATVILAGVGELDRVAACTKYCADVVPEVLQGSRLIIADSWTCQASEILAAKPDLVIAAVPYQEAAVAEMLKAGVRFLALAPRTLDDIYTDIALIAGVVDAGDRGAQLISKMEEEIADLRCQTAGLPRKRVFCEEWGKPVIASQPWVAELVQAAGGEFLGEPGRQCSAGEVLQLDPEVIIAAWCGASDRVPLAKIISSRGWSQTTAAQNSQVYCISDELLNTPAPTLLGGLRALGAAIHPELFGPTQGLRSISEMSPASTPAPSRVV